jgi:DNA-binding LytR/AlgR family response regulator
VSAIRAVLCDNEPSWIETATRVLSEYGRESGCELKVTSYTSPNELLESNELAPDVLFCDIELGETENGIDLVGGLSHRWPRCQVVYVTNFLRYAPEVYVTEHLWFVLKDSFAERLPSVIESLLRQMEDGSKTITIETVSHELLSLPCTQIVVLERRARVTSITCVSGDTYVVSDRLVALMERLPQRIFAQCHGSFVVGLSHIRMVRHDTILLDGGIEVPLSRRFVRGFRERYLDWADDHAL